MSIQLSPSRREHLPLRVLREKTPSDAVPPIIAGAFVTATVMYPVDVVRAISMANPGQSALGGLRWFIRENGVAGFVRQGLVPEVLRATLARGVKFSGLGPIHTTLFGRDFEKGSVLSRSIAGSLATIAEIALCSPFENVKLAEQLAKDPALNIQLRGGSTGIGQYIINQRGPWALWTGYAGMQGRQMLWSGVYFGTVNKFVAGVDALSPHTPSVLNKLLGGFFAGSFAAVFSCPFDVCRTGIQKAQLAAVFQRSSATKMTAWDVSAGDTAAIVREGRAITARVGWGGLWAGIGPKMAYLGGGGAILAWIMPVFTARWFEYCGIRE